MNIIIVHGAYGYPDENWFGWLKFQLNCLKYRCDIPRLPTPVGQSLKNWYERFHQQVGCLINPGTIMVGHSLGAIFLLRYLSHFDLHVHACILVGAFYQQVGDARFDQINHEFLCLPHDWTRWRCLANQFYCYHSTNDPYVAESQFDDISSALNATRLIISEAGHFNTASGYTEFPHLLRHILRQRI